MTIKLVSVVLILYVVILSVSSNDIFKLNPGCDGNPLCNDPTFANSAVHATINETVHFIFWQGGDKRIPSLTIVKTVANQTLNFNWTCLLNDTCECEQCGFLNYSDDSILSYMTLFFPFIQYKSGHTCLISSQIQKWQFLIEENLVTLMSIASKGQNVSEQVQINISVRLDYITDRTLPGLATSNQSFFIDISIAGQIEQLTGLQCAVISSPENQVHKNLTVITTNVINDEFMPGVFEERQLLIENDIHIQWKPVVFTSQKREITQWCQMSHQNSLDHVNFSDFNSSILRLPLCSISHSELRRHQLINVALLNFTFELSDSSQEKQQYVSWTMSTGYHLPRKLKTKFSTFTLTFICINFSIPLFVLLCSEIVALFRSRQLFGFNLETLSSLSLLRESAYQEIVNNNEM